MSRTFPRIGKIRESTPFQRGMNSKAVLDSEIRGKKMRQSLPQNLKPLFSPPTQIKKKSDIFKTVKFNH